MENLMQIFQNFENGWHSYAKICKGKGVVDKPVRLNLLPMIAARPYTHFCTKYLPGPAPAPPFDVEWC